MIFNWVIVIELIIILIMVIIGRRQERKIIAMQQKIQEKQMTLNEQTFDSIVDLKKRVKKLEKNK